MTDIRPTDIVPAVPDVTWVSLHTTITATTDPARVRVLQDTMTAWLRATDRVGTILDIARAYEAGDEVLEVRTPVGQIVAIPVPSARDAGAQFTEQFRLPVTRTGDTYRVLMQEWPSARAA